MLPCSLPIADPESVRSCSHARAGFTLLELAIVAGIIAVLAAAAVPATSTIVGYQMRKSTRQELARIGAACGEYFRDTLAFPDEFGDLLVDSKLAGWAGPYLPGEQTDPRIEPSSQGFDPWSRPYKLSARGDVLRAASAGEDAVFGSDDDLAIELDVTWIRRELTLERLRVINQALALYNGVYQLTQPLRADYASIYATLVTAGFLPSSTDFQRDAWGDAFVADPIGVVPVLRAGSVHLNAGS